MNNLVILQKPAHLRHRTASLVLCIVIINCMLSALTGCYSKKLALSSPISVTDYKLNTYVQIDSYTNVNKNVLSDALGLCDYYEHIFSRTLETSELYKVNTQQTTAISDELYELIELGLYYSQLSYGAFDITIGSVSRLWDFNTDTPDVPDSSAITDALAYVDYTKVSLSTDNDGTHHISIPDGYCLDLGAIAKGYIAAKINDSTFDAIIVVLLLLIFAVFSLIAHPILWLIGKKNPVAKEKASDAVARFMFRLILFVCGTKTTAIGVENIPTDKPVLFVGNHRGFFDVIISYTYIKTRAAYVAKKEMAKVPILRVWMRNIRCLLLDRQNTREALKSILSGLQILQKYYSVLQE